MLELSSLAGSPSLWDKKTEGCGERGLCSPAAGILAGKGAEPLLLLFHKSRLLTRKDQIVAVKYPCIVENVNAEQLPLNFQWCLVPGRERRTATGEKPEERRPPLQNPRHPPPLFGACNSLAHPPTLARMEEKVRHRKSLPEQVKPEVWGENAPRPQCPHPQPISHCRCPGSGLESSSEMSFLGKHSDRRNLAQLCVPGPPVFRESGCGRLRGGSRYQE